MHRTNRVSRPARWCVLLTLLVMGSLAAQRINAQEGMVKGLIVPINLTKEITMKQGRLVKEVKIENPALVKITLSPDYKTIFLTGQEAGSTKLRIVDSADMVEMYEIVVQADVEYLRETLRRTVPTANVEPIPIGKDTFIISGTVQKAEDLDILIRTAQSVAPKVIPAIRVGGVQQVQLDVVIAAVNRQELREMSFNFLNTGKHHFLASALSTNNAANGTNVLSVASGAASLIGTSNVLFGWVNDEQGFFGFLQALRTEGLAKFLAEPKLVTTSGRPATFLSGGRLAIPEPSGLGTNAVRFEDFGTQLNFLPIVLGNGRIWLEVEPTVNIINAANGTVIQGTSVPGFDTQRLHTSVELEDGQTFAIGGLIQNTVNATTTKVPILGDIPFLNPLFSTKSYKQTEQELLILVTPHLVDGQTCNQLPPQLPGQETRIVDDFELFLEGILEAPRGQRNVFAGHQYVPAYKNGPTSGTYPCGAYGGNCGINGACGSGNCLGTSGCSSCTSGTGTMGTITAPMQPMALPTSSSSAPRTTPVSYEGQGTTQESFPVALPPVTNIPDSGMTGTTSAGVQVTPGLEPAGTR